MEKISIFIDGDNFYHSLKKIYGSSKNYNDFNFEKFCNFLAKGRKIISIFYYNASLDITKNLEKYKGQQRFFEKIKKIQGFNLVLCKLIKRKIKGTEKFYYIIKEDDIHLAADMIKGAYENLYDAAVLVSGDGDFVPAVNIVKERGKKVENAYFKQTLSWNLKNNCNTSIKLTKEILDKFFEKQDE